MNSVLKTIISATEF